MYYTFINTLRLIYLACVMKTLTAAAKNINK